MKLRQIVEFEIDTAEGKYCPDDFHMKEGAGTFIYWKNKLIYDTEYGKTHMHLLERYPQIVGLQDYQKDPWDDNSKSLVQMISKKRMSMLEDVSIAGRTHHSGKAVAFWNTSTQLLKLGFKKCLEELVKNNLITQQAEIHIPGNNILTVQQIFKTQDQVKTTKMSDEETRKLQLKKELHTMDGVSKKAAMKELGIPMGSMSKQKQGMPGQKWWAPSSESID